MMHNFGVWLISPDGGCKNMRSAKQYRNVVISVVGYLDPERKDYEKFFSRKDLNLWMTEFENRGNKPGTIKTYLWSVKQLYDYIAVHGQKNISLNNNQISTMKILVGRWCRNLHKKVQIQHHEKNDGRPSKTT